MSKLIELRATTRKPEKDWEFKDEIFIDVNRDGPCLKIYSGGKIIAEARLTPHEGLRLIELIAGVVFARLPYPDDDE